MEFSNINMNEELKHSLKLLGYQTMTPIQEAVIPILMKHQDVVGISQTGSGKTAAFGIPICNQIFWEENDPQALILEPARELAVQVRDEIYQIGRQRKIKIPVVFGGMPIDKEFLSLKQKAHIVVGTPGRVLDHIRRGTLKTENMKILVLDEADFMLDLGFLEEVTEILRILKEQNPVIALFSATIGPEIDDLIAKYLCNPARIQIASKLRTADGIEQTGFEVDREKKFDLLLYLLLQENPEDCLIFCDTREMVNTVCQKLKRKKIRCTMLHGGLDQRERLYAVNDFRKGKCHILVTTDVAARGIDFPDLSHVFHYDFPTNKENYVHRSGRTARNGKKGKVFSFLDETERKYKEAVEEYIGATIEMGEVPEEIAENKQIHLSGTAFSARQKEKIVVKEGRSAAYQQSIMKLTIGGGKKSKMRAGDIVGALCSIPNVTMEDIGAIDVRDSITYVEIFHGKGNQVLKELQRKTIKGKVRKIQKSKSQE